MAHFLRTSWSSWRSSQSSRNILDYDCPANTFPLHGYSGHRDSWLLSPISLATARTFRVASSAGGRQLSSVLLASHSSPGGDGKSLRSLRWSLCYNGAALALGGRWNPASVRRCSWSDSLSGWHGRNHVRTPFLVFASRESVQKKNSTLLATEREVGLCRRRSLSAAEFKSVKMKSIRIIENSSLRPEDTPRLRSARADGRLTERQFSKTRQECRSI